MRDRHPEPETNHRRGHFSLSASEQDKLHSAPGAAPPDPEALHELLRTLAEQLKAAEKESARRIGSLPAERRSSAANLVNYLRLRSEDLRRLQDGLTHLGLSSLGRAEAHVLWNVETVMGILARGGPRAGDDPQVTTPAVTPEVAWGILDANTEKLLGPAPPDRTTRIMVTMPTEAGEDPAFVRELVEAGMDCMRINCAHDDPEVWGSMIRHLRAAERDVGCACRLAMDLPGPRVRTGPVELGPEVVRIEPKYDDYGKVREPARVWLTASEAPAAQPKRSAGTLPMPRTFLAALELDDVLEFEDAAGQTQRLTISGSDGGNRWAQLADTTHVTSGTRVKRVGGDGASAVIGHIPGVEQVLWLEAGDTLVLTRDPVAGRPAHVDGDTGEKDPARIGCLPAEVLDHVRPGERIWFDDGRIGGVIREVGDEINVEITRTRPGGDRLKPEKGINLPDSDLGLPALTREDLELLPFIAEHADIVGYSFVGTAEDVRQLRRSLKDAGRGDLGIILKIERNLAFQNLPELLLEGMHSPSMGVMIARGDLAVECGFARMAEVQEEILWLCTAAHVPVIWATQVMEQLAKLGRPSRAEVTDAAMGGRAECIMLNKGPHIPDAVKALISILDRMREHQQKKRSMLRRLEVAAHFFDGLPLETRGSG
jgi:pyruvate kinase